MPQQTTKSHGLEHLQQATHDLLLMLFLLDHHYLLVHGSYDPEHKGNCHELIKAGRNARSSPAKFKDLLCEQARAEFPEEKFPKHVIDDAVSGCWPPIITMSGRREKT